MLDCTHPLRGHLISVQLIAGVNGGCSRVSGIPRLRCERPFEAKGLFGVYGSGSYEEHLRLLAVRWFQRALLQSLRTDALWRWPWKVPSFLSQKHAFSGEAFSGRRA
jgi:hypothetical protein